MLFPAYLGLLFRRFFFFEEVYRGTKRKVIGPGVVAFFLASRPDRPVSGEVKDMGPLPHPTSGIIANQFA